MATHDKNGREYARMSELKVGDTVEIGGGMTCRDAGMATIFADRSGEFYITCRAGDGRHFLSVEVSGEEGDDHLIGVYLPGSVGEKEKATDETKPGDEADAKVAE
ncbi:MAG: hypothetical protein WAN65_08440 [Candidatus Sulfotelmatobacter sp.]